MIQTVGLFFLMLLKIAGWILLVLLAVILAVLLFVLFVPVRYRVFVQNEKALEPGSNLVKKLKVQVKVSWLLHLVYISMQYGPDGLSNHIRVAGIDIPKFLAKRAEKKENHKKKKAKKNKKSSKQESITDESLLQESLTEKAITDESRINESQTKESQMTESQMTEFPTDGFQTEKETFVPTEENIRQIDSKSEEVKKQLFENDKSESNKPGQDHLDPNNQKRNKSKQKKHGNRKYAKIKQSKEKQNQKSKQSILSKIRSQFQRFHQEFTDEVNRHALSHLWAELLKLLKSYKPRKLKADISFSLADPALTGMAIGAISLMPVIYRYPCSIAPDFTSEKLYVEGEILARGRVTVFVFLLSLLRLLRDKKFMYVVRRLLKRGGA